MSREFQDRCIQRLFETNENRLELIAELGMGIYEASDMSFDDLAAAVANKRFIEFSD